MGRLDPKLFTKHERVARAMSAHYNIKVIPSNECSTDGRNIYYPYGSEFLDGFSKQSLEGLLDHELSHIQREDFHKENGEKTPLEYFKNYKDGKQKLTFNIFEDLGSEKYYSEKFVGVAENLRTLLFDASRKVREDYKKSGKMNFWTMMASGIPLEYHGESTDWMGEKHQKCLEIIKDEIRDAKSIVFARDSHELMLRTIYKLKKYMEELKEDSKEKVGVDFELGDGCGGDLIDEIKKDIKRKIKEERESTEQYRTDPEIKKLDRWITASEDSVTFHKAYGDVSKYIRAMKRKMVRVLKSKSLNTVVGGREEGELDSDEFHTVKLGNRNIYTQEVEGESIDTAVLVWIDLSGSMGGCNTPGRCSYYAQRTVIALAETFDSLGISFEVAGFYNDATPAGYRSCDSKNENIRIEPFAFVFFKKFEEKYRKVCNRFGTITGYGNNVDGEALHEAAKRLSQREEGRKILIAISDGEPCGGRVNGRILQRHLQEVVKMVTSSGIEVVGIGAGTNSVRHYFNKENGASHIVIKDFEKLAVETYKVMREQFVKKHRRRSA